MNCLPFELAPWIFALDFTCISARLISEAIFDKMLLLSSGCATIKRPPGDAYSRLAPRSPTGFALRFRRDLQLRFQPAPWVWASHLKGLANSDIVFSTPRICCKRRSTLSDPMLVGSTSLRLKVPIALSIGRILLTEVPQTLTGL